MRRRQRDGERDESNQIRSRENRPCRAVVKHDQEIQQTQRTNHGARSRADHSSIVASRKFERTWRTLERRFHSVSPYDYHWVIITDRVYHQAEMRTITCGWCLLFMIDRWLSSLSARNRGDTGNHVEQPPSGALTSGDTTGPTGPPIYTLGVRYAFSTKIHEVKAK